MPQSGLPAPKIEEGFRAIWDTGATNSVIMQPVIDKCGLQATGMARVQHAQGAADCETFLVNIGLPNKVMVTAVRVTRGDLPDTDVLIGMDVINLGDFSVTNVNGITKCSFRFPSIEHVDYVQEANTLQRQPTPDRPSRAERRRAKKERH